MTGQRFKKRGLGLVIYRGSLQISLNRADSPQEKGKTMAKCELVANWELNAQSASIDDLEMAIDWIGSLETDDSEVAQSMINAMNFIVKQISAKQRKVAINEAKRNYAKENGVKFSQVKISKKVGA